MTLKPEQLGMVETLETPPNWNYYGWSSDQTRAVHKFWTDKNLGGGPLVGNLKAGSINKITTPLMKQITSAKTYGEYQIKKIQAS